MFYPSLPLFFLSPKLIQGSEENNKICNSMQMQNCIHMLTLTRKLTDTDTSTHACTHAHTHTHTHTYIHTHTKCTYMRACTHTHIHTHTYTNTQSKETYQTTRNLICLVCWDSSLLHWNIPLSNQPKSRKNWPAVYTVMPFSTQSTCLKYTKNVSYVYKVFYAGYNLKACDKSSIAEHALLARCLFLTNNLPFKMTFQGAEVLQNHPTEETHIKLLAVILVSDFHIKLLPLLLHSICQAKW